MYGKKIHNYAQNYLPFSDLRYEEFPSESREKCTKKRWFSPFFHSASMKIHCLTNRRTAGDSPPNFAISSHASLRCAMNSQILNCIESCPVDVSHLNPAISWTIRYWSINRTTKWCIWRIYKIKRSFTSRSPILMQSIFIEAQLKKGKNRRF